MCTCTRHASSARARSRARVDDAADAHADALLVGPSNQPTDNRLCLKSVRKPKSKAPNQDRLNAHTRAKDRKIETCRPLRPLLMLPAAPSCLAARLIARPSPAGVPPYWRPAPAPFLRESASDDRDRRQHVFHPRHCIASNASNARHQPHTRMPLGDFSFQTLPTDF